MNVHSKHTEIARKSSDALSMTHSVIRTISKMHVQTLFLVFQNFKG